MTTICFVARMKDVPGAPERMLGLLRRRGAAIARLSMRRVEANTLEVELALDRLNAAPDRVEAELRELVDVVSLQRNHDPRHLENTDGPDPL